MRANKDQRSKQSLGEHSHERRIFAVEPVRAKRSLSVSTPLLIGLALTMVGCTDGELKAIDRLSNGPAERQMREKVLASMPANQSKLLESFRSACTHYDNSHKPNYDG